MFELRDYQNECHNDIVKWMKGGGSSGIVVAPTAWGKSLGIGYLAKEVGNTIVLSPSKEILYQNYSKYISYGGEASIFSASMGCKEMGKVTFATIGSVKHLGKEFKKLGISLLQIDESHLHSNPEGGMFKSFLKDLSPKYLIGWTATPFRMKSYSDPSGYSYSQLNMLNRTRPKLFKDFIHVTQISELTERGYWAPVEYHKEDFNPLGLVLNSTGAEYTDSSIHNVVKNNNINNRIYKKIKQLISDGVGSILVFMDSVENCYTMKNALGNIADVVEANTNKKLRTEIVEDFKSSKLKVILNVNTLTIGFDYPQLEVVIMGRPTNSLAVIYQIYGRLVRPYEGKVGKFYDYGGNIDKFGEFEGLTIENYNTYGWGVFNGDELLTGKPMGGERVMKSALDGMKLGGFKNSDKPYFEFGKHKDVPLDQVPLGYIQWACKEAKHNMSEVLYNLCIKRMTAL